MRDVGFGVRLVWGICAAGLLAGGGCRKDDKERLPPVEEQGGQNTGGSLVGVGGDGWTGGDGGLAGAGRVSGGAEEAGGAGGDVNTGGSGNPPPTLPIGTACDEDADCGLGARCFYGPGSGTATCRVECPLASVGEPGPCGDGSLCVLGAGALEAACLTQCEPDSPSCPPVDWCVPNPNPLYTGGLEVAGLCNTRGTAVTGDGEACETRSCQAGLACYTAAYVGGGPAHCEPLCDVTASSSVAAGCAEGELCRRLTTTAGVCLRLCDPFGEESCPTGQWCAPYRELGSGDEPVLEGQCIAAGATASGDACTAGDCAAGALCGRVASAYGATPARCGAVCDPTADGCDGATCVPVVSGATELGSCQSGCAPFLQGQEAGCAADQWCAPTATEGLGVCKEPGTVGLGATCSGVSDCGAGAYCDCRFGVDASCAPEHGRCEAACLPGATEEQLGACPSGAVCVPKITSGSAQAFGLCRPSCDAEGSVGCAEADESCVPGALLGTGADACFDLPLPLLAPGDACGSDRELGEPCGPDAVCAWDPEAGPRCVETCRFALGAPDSTEHPDCASATARCVELAPGLAYGRCE